MMEDIRVLDTTLRDGEQAVGVIFTRWEKEQIATLLASIGITAIEAGYPILGPEEKACVKAVVDADIKVAGGRSFDSAQGLALRFQDDNVGEERPLEINAFARARAEDVREAAECGVDSVIISISTSDVHIERKFRKSRDWVLAQMEDAVAEAKRHGLMFTVSAEDASRTDMAFLMEYYELAKALGARMVRYCDTLSVEDPYTTYRRIKFITQRLDVPLEVHMHNDFGMGTANALAGIRAGARSVAASVGGLGERAGNSPMEEVVMALKHLRDIDLGIDTSRFREIATYVADASRRAVPIWKAIVGTNVFAHESGIHADGILKDPTSYEAFSPEEVGLERQIIIGKHSGSKAIMHKFSAEFGIELEQDTARDLLERVRSMAVELKRPLFSKELMLLYKEIQRA